MSSPQETKPSPAKKVNHISLGLTLAVGMMAFVMGGIYLDKKTGHEQLFTLIGFALGMIFGSYEIWKVIKNVK